MKTLGLAMIVKNESDNLEALLKSVEGCFDEIHITDTGSTDNTVEIAKKYGCHVHHFDWCDDFAKARNASFEPVKTDYVMWLDGDDVLVNKEAFITWKKDVMMIADYWVNRYVYSFDRQTDQPTCEFLRERVFNNKKGFKWQYFLHEGVIPKVESGAPVVTQLALGWYVKHMRSEADLLKDRSRNINIMEKNLASLDDRMSYYLGKELFEAGQPEKACEVFEKLLSKPNSNLEMHDRIISIQYWGYALHQINKYEKVINAMQTGLLLDPTRAEFNVLIADAYLKCNQLHQALPYLGAAKYTLENNGVGVVFKNKDSYGPYPTKQIARIYAQLGNFEVARKEAEEGKAKWPHDKEFQILLDELDKLKKIEVGFKSALPSEDIVFSTPPVNAYEWDGDIYKTQAMGGSETACIEVAQWIKKLTGRNVIVFNMRKDAKIVEGVQYRPNSELNEYMSRNRPYIHIAWRHNIKVTDAPTFVWSHDLQTQFAEFTDRYIKIMCLTPWHARFLSLTQGVPMDKIYLTRNGLVPEKFEGLNKIEKVKNRFVFGSSPDRGLDRAIRVLKEVRKEFPDVTLSVHYGIEHLPKYGHQELHDRLAKEFEENKNWIFYRGKTEQKDLMKSYAASQYCIQPSDWLETSMLSCIELVACGVYVMLRKVGGAVDTLTPFVEKGVAEFIDERCESDEEYEIYIERTKAAIREEKWKKVIVTDADFPTWESVARQWVKDLPELINVSKA